MSLIDQDLLQIIEESKRRYAGRIDASASGLREWLAQGGAYYVVSSRSGELLLEAVDDSWRTANGADIGRYFWASWESLLPRTCADYDSRSIGWAAVSSYYAGFYLSLALLRLFGEGLMYFSARDASLLSAASGNAIALTRGVYSASIELGARTQLRLKVRNAGGFHDAFWKHTDSSLGRIAEDIGAGRGTAKVFSEQVRSAAMLNIETIREWLGAPSTVGRHVGWMSELRNEVNYRLGCRVWSPHFREDAVRAERLRQDIVAIVRGRRDRLGVQLRMDKDVRSMMERVCVLFRAVSLVTDFPPVLRAQLG